MASRKLRIYSLPFRGISAASSTDELNFDTNSKLLGGWVYILSNPVMPGIYKVGMTTINPETRAKDISRGTGVPTPFVVEKSFHVENPAQAEKEIHEALSEYRVNDNREFFECSIEEICEAIYEIGAWESGNCLDEIFANKKFITSDKYTRQTRTLKITEELYDRLLEESFGDINAIVENILTMNIEQLNCHVFFDERKAIAFKSQINPPSTKESEVSPTLISEVEIKGLSL